MRGSLDGVQPDGRVYGWCWSPDEPALRRGVSILLDQREAVRCVADVLREDLLAASIGDGGHGFAAIIPAALRERGGATISLRDAGTGRQVGSDLAITWDRAPAAPPKLTGNLDLLTRDGWLSGWCWEPARPDQRLLLDVLVDDEVVGCVEAAEARADLRAAGVGDGGYGFTFLLPYEALAERGTVRVAVAEHATGRTLGEPALVRIGRRAEADSRLRELERQLQVMRGRIDEAARAAERAPQFEVLAAQKLFATVAAFFQGLADGGPVAGLSGGLGPTLADLRARLPPLALRRPHLDAHGLPRLIVAVPATARVEAVHDCLASLHRAGADAQAEIVLLDPGGTDPSCALLPALVANLRVGPPAEGSVACLARLLREADAPLVGLVSPDLLPAEGCLEALVATIEERSAALVAAVVVRPDGRLQHAGFVLDGDARLRDLGHLDSPDRSEHRALRPVEAVAAGVLVVDRARVLAAGGVDEGFAALDPAIAALCLSLRAAGGAVLRQPAAVALARDPGLEPSTAFASDPTSEDGRRLRLAILATARDARAGCFVGRAVVIDTELPVAARDAGSVVAIEQMLVLGRLGWRVTFAASGMHAAAEGDRRQIERMGIEVADQTGDSSLVDLLAELGPELDLVHLYRHPLATLLLPRVRELAPRAKVLFSPADLHFLREMREAAVLGQKPTRPAAVRAAELACVRAADATILLSDHERDLLAAEVIPDRLHLLRWIARPAAAVAGFEARDGLVFVGNFRHAPNVDAMLWYAREVLPIVARLGLVTLDIIGGDAPPAIRALDGGLIRVRGWVEDLAPSLSRARLAIAPLRYGAGFKGKVATALASGLPVVGTSIAFEGTGLADGDGIVVADDAEAFAHAITRTHADATGWRALSARAVERVAALYSPRAADAVFRGLLGGLGLPTIG